MDRSSAMHTLNVGEDATQQSIQAAFVLRKAELEGQLAQATDETFQDRCQRALVNLDKAFEVLGSASPAQVTTQTLTPIPMSATMMRDLPGGTPFYTQDGTGGLGVPSVAGARVGITEGQVLVGRYTVLRVLGAGGMGAVYAALDANRNEDIAIKVLLPGLLRDPAAKERFLAEAQISTKLSHPNIVNVYDVQKDGDFHFITMELLEGRTLRQEMETRKNLKKPFAVEEVKSLAIQLSEALAYAHKQTVHRDVKPENIWLMPDDSVKLMDFGIARLLSTSQLTMTGTSMGTAYYMAPEQLKGAKDIDGRADQYALAAVLYEMLTGEVPAGALRPPHGLRKDIPRGLSEAVMKTLSPKREDRFTDMASFRNAIGSRTRKPRRMAKAILIGMGVAAVAFLVVITLPKWKGPVFLAVYDFWEGQEKYRPRALELQGQITEANKGIQTTVNAERERLQEVSTACDQLTSRLDSTQSADQRNQTAKDLEIAKRDLVFLKAARDLLEKAVLRGDRMNTISGKVALALGLVNDGKFHESILPSEEAMKELAELVADAEACLPAIQSQNQLEEVRSNVEKVLQDAGVDKPTPLKQADEKAEQTVVLLNQGAFRKASEQFASLVESYTQHQSQKEAILKAGTSLVTVQDAQQKTEAALNNHKEIVLPKIAEAIRERAEGTDALKAGVYADGKSHFDAAVTIFVQGLAQIQDVEKAQQTMAAAAQSCRTTLERASLLEPSHTAAVDEAMVPVAEQLSHGRIEGALAVYAKVQALYETIERRVKGYIDACYVYDDRRVRITDALKANHYGSATELVMLDGKRQEASKLAASMKYEEATRTLEDATHAYDDTLTQIAMLSSAAAEYMQAKTAWDALAQDHGLADTKNRQDAANSATDAEKLAIRGSYTDATQAYKDAQRQYTETTTQAGATLRTKDVCQQSRALWQAFCKQMSASGFKDVPSDSSTMDENKQADESMLKGGFVEATLHYSRAAAEFDDILATAKSNRVKQLYTLAANQQDSHPDQAMDEINELLNIQPDHEAALHLKVSLIQTIERLQAEAKAKLEREQAEARAKLEREQLAHKQEQAAQVKHAADLVKWKAWQDSWCGTWKPAPLYDGTPSLPSKIDSIPQGKLVIEAVGENSIRITADYSGYDKLAAENVLDLVICATMYMQRTSGKIKSVVIDYDQKPAAKGGLSVSGDFHAVKPGTSRDEDIKSKTCRITRDDDDPHLYLIIEEGDHQIIQYFKK